MSLSFDSMFAIITDVGDTASLLAITAAGSLYLLSRRAKRAAMFLIATLVITGTFISLAKLAFLGCHSTFHHSGIHSPSGHTAMSAALFWAYALLMRRHLEGARRTYPLLLLTLLIATIAVSRVWLGYHSVEEVAAGLVVGAFGLFFTHFLVMRGKETSAFDAYALALWGVIAAFAVHGYRIPSERLIHMIAVHISGHVSFCGA